jgi:uncharacterized protein YjdB
MLLMFRSTGPGVLALFAALAIGGCDESTRIVDPALTASESSIFLGIGETQTLTVSRVPSNAAFEALSEDVTVATVVQSGTGVTITGVEVGFATVVLTLSDYPAIQFNVTVEVTPT